MEESFQGVVKQAFFEANINHDCELEYQTEATVIAGVRGARCIVRYKGGNEYVRVDKLLERLKQYGDIRVVELRARGSNEANQLMIEMRVGGELNQVIYLLP